MYTFLTIEYREMLKRVDRVRAEWAVGLQAQDSSNSSNNNDSSGSMNSNSGISMNSSGSSVNKSGGGRYSLVLLDEIGTGRMILLYIIVLHTAAIYV